MLTEKDYCDYDTCVALKELRFSQYHSDRVYAGEGGVWTWNFEGEPNYNEGELIRQEDLFGVPTDGNEVAAPLLYEAHKWLREEKGLHIEIDRVGYDWLVSVIETKNNLCLDVKNRCQSYEEALLEGVRASIKILQDEQKENN